MINNSKTLHLSKGIIEPIDEDCWKDKLPTETCDICNRKFERITGHYYEYTPYRDKNGYGCICNSNKCKTMLTLQLL
jgi:hypothetical protein